MATPLYMLPQPWEDQDPYGVPGGYYSGPPMPPPPPPPAPPMPEATMPEVGLPPIDPMPPTVGGYGLPQNTQIRAIPPDPYADILARRSEHMKTMPKRTDPNVRLSTGQQVGGIVQNALAGWVNAGRRGHIDPVDMRGLADRRYADAMQQWKNEGAQIDADLQAAQMREQVRRQQEIDERNGRMADANIRLAEAHARDYDELKQNRTPQRYFNLGKAGMWDAQEGRIVPGTTTPEKPAEETSAEAIERRKKDADTLGLKPGTDEYKYYLANGKMPAPQRARAVGARTQSVGPKPATAAQSIGIENRKAAALAKAETDYRRSLDRGADPKVALAALEQRKKQAQTDYEAAIVAAGGSIVSPTDTVRVKNPQGQTGSIPRSQLESAKKAGYVEIP